MPEGEPKKSRKKTVWKNVFVGSNPDTGKKYFERRKVTVSKPTKKKVFSPEIKVRPTLTKKDRGNYNADIVGDAMEKRDEEKERNVRMAKGLPPEE
jgi:hypothetical protein